MICTCKKILLV